LQRFILGNLFLVLTLICTVDGQVTSPSATKALELSASTQDDKGAVDVDGTLLLPRTKEPIRAVIVVLGWGVGSGVYKDPAWRHLAEELRCGFLRLVINNHGGPEDPLDLPVAQQAVRNASLGGAQALLKLFSEFSRLAGRPELASAKVVFWGHSAAGSFGTTFAALHPTQTIAFIRYHSHSRGLPVDLATVSRIPALIFAGEKDTTAGVEDSEMLWRSGRSVDAPWTFALEPGANHASADALKTANELAIPWLRAVMAQRLPSKSGELRVVSGNTGWLASNRNDEVSPARSFRHEKDSASWLPDQDSAKGWRIVTGGVGR